MTDDILIEGVEKRDIVIADYLPRSPANPRQRPTALRVSQAPPRGAVLAGHERLCAGENRGGADHRPGPGKWRCGPSGPDVGAGLLAHPEGDVRTWITNRLIPGGGVVVVDDIANGVVAIMAISRRDGVGWLDHMYVHPSFVGRGLGSRLLAHARAALGSPIRLYTFQANEGARRFYERPGFRPVVFGDGSGNEERCPDALYEWSDDDGTRDDSSRPR